MTNAMVHHGTRNVSPHSDPTLLFAIFCTIGPILFSYEKIDSIQVVYNYLTEAPFLGILSAGIIFDLFPQILSFFELLGLPLQPNPKNNNKKKNGNGNSDSSEKLVMSSSQYKIARWYLVNGLYFHMLLDSISGTFSSWSLMSASYKELDERFYEPLSAEGMVTTLVTQLEQWTMTPICLLIYYGYRCHAIKVSNGNGKYIVKHEKWIHIAEIIVSMLQMIGCWFFYLGEIVHVVFGTGLEKSPFDKNFEFTFKHITYFWLSFCIIPLIWVFVPLWMIRRSARDLIY